jgi:hypothetical protein
MMKTKAGISVNRRAMLLGLGGSAAAFTFVGCEPPTPTPGQPTNLPGNDVVQLFTQLDVLTRDTLAGVIAMLVPGNDAYSLWQGVSMPESGGLAARGDEYLAHYLNKYFPVPPLGQIISSALFPRLSSITLPLPSGVVSAVLRPILQNYGSIYSNAVHANNLTLPLAPLVAAILNFLAVTVRPTSVVGPFLTPFPRLTYREKGEVWNRFEVFVPDYFSPGSATSILPPGNYPDVIRTLPGLLDYASGVVPALAVFGSYSEWHVFDYNTRTITARPVGYRLSDYGGPVEGWDEFKGYYQGRRSATDA